MRNPFRKSAIAADPAEQALQALGISYTRGEDGTLLVAGDIDLACRGLKTLPNLSSAIVAGSFNCTGNQLTSLKGAPRAVGGGFYCAHNQLTSLEHAPQSVGDSFSCEYNRLVTLAGAPGAVGFVFSCSDNLLTSLEGAPRGVGHYFFCQRNRLTSLEGAPAAFKGLESDFGNFRSWSEVPEELRSCPATAEKRAARFARGATVLEKDMPLRKPLVLRKPQ